MIKDGAEDIVAADVKHLEEVIFMLLHNCDQYYANTVLLSQLQ